MSRFPALLLLPLLGAPARAQSSTEQYPATARVTTALALAFESVPGSGSLSWGDVVPGKEASGSVSLDPQTGQRRAQGGATLPPTSTLPQHPARILIHGIPNAHVSISISPSQGQMEASGGGKVGYAALFCSVEGGTPISVEGHIPGTLSGSGQLAFQLGGTVLVGANQRPGDYAGSFDATVSYN